MKKKVHVICKDKTREEVIALIRANTEPETLLARGKKVFSRFEGDNYVVLQQRNNATTRGYFQKVFICKVIQEGSGCRIKGAFETRPSICFLSVCSFLVFFIPHLLVLFSGVDLQQLISATKALIPGYCISLVPIAVPHFCFGDQAQALLDYLEVL